LLGADVSPALVIIDPAKVGTTYTQNYTFQNKYGPFTGGASGGALGSAERARPTIADQTQELAAWEVPAGSASLRVKIGNTSDLKADLDLYVFLESDGVPGLSAGDALVGLSADADAEEEVDLASPPAGVYYALIDGFNVPSGATAYDYLDVFVNASLGSVSISDPAAAHASGATWTGVAQVLPKAVPAAGRFLQGQVNVLSGTAVLGTGEIDLNNVAP
jgi:hypothetical protein